MDGMKGAPAESAPGTRYGELPYWMARALINQVIADRPSALVQKLSFSVAVELGAAASDVQLAA